MQVSVEAPNTLERRLTVVVPVEKLEEAYHKRIVNLAKTAKIKGFRQGKIPLSYVKKLYGDSAREGALGEVIQASLTNALTQEKLTPVNIPTIEPKSLQPGQPLEFVAVFEVVPEVTAVNFELETLEKQVSAIETDDVENVLTHLRKQQTTWHKVERAAKEGDQVILDFRGSIDGQAFSGGEAHDYPIVIGSKTMIPGFEEGLVGITADEERVVQVTFPDNYFSADFAGKAAEFSIKAHGISEPLMPEADEAFIKKMGVKSGNLEDFKAEIRKNLERELLRVMQSKLKNQVFDQLISQNPLEVPKAMIEREAKRIHDELHPHHAGKDHGHTEAEMATFNEAGRRNVALGLLIGFLIKQHELTVDKTRIDNKIQQLSSVYENPAEIVHWYSSNKRAKAEIEMLVLEEQLVEKLLEKVQVSEKKVSYNELISNKISKI